MKPCLFCLSLFATLHMFAQVYLEHDGLVVMEVESQDPGDYFILEDSVAGHEGTGYFRGRIDSFNQPGRSPVTYPFRVTDAGTYQFAYRSRIGEGTSTTDYNDTFVRMVDSEGLPVSPVPNQNVATGTWFKTYMNAANTWSNQASNKDNDPHSLSWRLESGKDYAIQISVRSAGHLVDRLILWDRSRYALANQTTGKGANEAAFDALEASTWVSALNANWILIDDFESYEAGSYTSGGDPGLVYATSTRGTGTVGLMSIVEGVPGTGGERAAYFSYSLIPEADCWHQIPLPREIGINEAGTVFFRVWQIEYNLNWHVMLSKVPADVVTHDEDRWPDNAAILRHYGDEPDTLEAYDGFSVMGGYTGADPVFLPEVEAWFDYWIVLDNAYATGAQAGGYRIYRRKTGETTPVLTTWQRGDGEPVGELEFRNKALASIKSLVLIQNGVHGHGLWLIDDIYMTQGVCLSDPTAGEICTSWCAYPVIGGHADTGSWLGWIYAASEPWLYSYDLDGWIYVSDCPDAGGAWVYVP